MALRILIASVLALTFACTSGRTATETGDRYGCATQADCLGGYSCSACGFCEPVGSTSLACGVGDAGGSGDADVGDTTGTADATIDAGVDAGLDGGVDTGPDVDASGPCNLLTWAPCPAGTGCYYDEGTTATHCEAHGSGKVGTGCNPGADPYSCGVGDDGSRRYCDALDKKCYRLCKCGARVSTDCKVAETCWCLSGSDQVSYPDSVGVCVPN